MRTFFQNFLIGVAQGLGLSLAHRLGRRCDHASVQVLSPARGVCSLCGRTFRLWSAEGEQRSSGQVPLFNRPRTTWSV